jgi:hypothetical protein
MCGDSDSINETLIKFNEKLLDYVKKSIEPLLIIKNELNALLIICSDDLRVKINEHIALVTDYNNEMQKCLSMISPHDSNVMTRELQTFGHDDRWLHFQSLKDEIEILMRKEIGTK